MHYVWTYGGKRRWEEGEESRRLCSQLHSSLALHRLGWTRCTRLVLAESRRQRRDRKVVCAQRSVFLSACRDGVGHA